MWPQASYSVSVKWQLWGGQGGAAEWLSCSRMLSWASSNSAPGRDASNLYRDWEADKKRTCSPPRRLFTGLRQIHVSTGKEWKELRVSYSSEIRTCHSGFLRCALFLICQSASLDILELCCGEKHRLGAGRPWAPETHLLLNDPVGLEQIRSGIWASRPSSGDHH